MLMKVIYCGFFIDKDELAQCFEPKLARAIEFPHVTTAFRPNGMELFEGMLGEEIHVRVSGYGNDGRNEGVSVILEDGSERARRVFEQIAMPHITISVAEDGKPVDTAKLNFEAVDNGAVLTAKYGWFCSDGAPRFRI